MLKPQDIYVSEEIYAELRAELTAQLAALQRFDPDTDAVRILGEIRGVWPVSVLEDEDAA
ncbi:hypothetical protein K3718_10760 [Leisingera aquaemixtae]|uniref:Uncharacterized protein n=1 Tax=Leisingera aquaemixtae TaxID=1396826 RepID=A0ABY5WF39_9RHOB|nr:hypothetical protein [Leisingera aquaemixtae]UWQ40055.1 hypothetical protein K3718_10760 [Leisingera aquaemixtae]